MRAPRSLVFLGFLPYLLMTAATVGAASGSDSRAHRGLASPGPSSPKAGARIRLTLPCERGSSSAGRSCLWVGKLAMVRADTISLVLADSTASFGLRDLARVEVSHGTRSHWLLGAGVGLVAGAGLTYLAVNSGGSTSPCDQSANQDALSTEECVGLVGLGGIAGAGLGALVGAFIRSERWEVVPVDHLRARLDPSPGGERGLSIALRF